MFNWFNKKEEVKEQKMLELGQAEVFLELYSGKTITLKIKGRQYFDGYYSPVKDELRSLTEKIEKNNVLEVDKGYFLNIRQEIKSVLIGPITSYKEPLKDDES